MGMRVKKSLTNNTGNGSISSAIFDIFGFYYLDHQPQEFAKVCLTAVSWEILVASKCRIWRRDIVLLEKRKT